MAPLPGLELDSRAGVPVHLPDEIVDAVGKGGEPLGQPRHRQQLAGDAAPGPCAPACAPFGRRGRQRLMDMLFQGADPGREAGEFLDLTSEHFVYRQETPPIFGDEELRRVTMPALYIGGGRDIVLHSRQTAARLQRLLPKVEAHVLPEAGHALIEVSGIVEDFLARACISSRICTA